MSHFNYSDNFKTHFETGQNMTENVLNYLS